MGDIDYQLRMQAQGHGELSYDQHGISDMFGATALPQTTPIRQHIENIIYSELEDK